MAGGMFQPYIIFLLDGGFVELLWVGMVGVDSGVNLSIGIGIGGDTLCLYY